MVSRGNWRYLLKFCPEWRFEGLPQTILEIERYNLCVLVHFRPVVYHSIVTLETSGLEPLFPPVYSSPLYACMLSVTQPACMAGWRTHCEHLAKWLDVLHYVYRQKLVAHECFAVSAQRTKLATRHVSVWTKTNAERTIITLNSRSNGRVGLLSTWL